MYHVDGFIQKCAGGGVAGVVGSVVDPAGPGHSSAFFTISGAGGSEALYDTCTSDAEIVLAAELGSDGQATTLPDMATLRTAMSKLVADEQAFQAAATKIVIH